MNISYKREMRSNYLIIEPENENWGYEHRMMLNNQIEGLLKFRVKQVDNNRFYYYEITSRQPLSRLLDGRTIRKKEIQNIILGIGNVLGQLERFLLKEEQILLEPDYIYLEPESFKPFFCLVPGWKGDFPKSLEKLLQYILKNVNHQDKESVVLAYSLYQESQKELYGIENLMKWIYVEREEEGFAGAEQENRAWDSRGQDSRVPENGLGAGIEWAERKAEVLGRREGDRRQKRLVTTAAAYMVGSPVVLWLMQGKAGLYRYGSILLIIDALVVLVLSIGIIWLNKKEKKKPERILVSKDESSEINSEVYFENNLAGISAPEEEGKDSFPAVENQEEGTVLLSNLEEKEGNHYLMSLDKEFPDICISYFPFVLGKQKNMVDYMMKKDTISRIHARIDRDLEGFLIKDLNSTNGTRVRGILLEANEEVRLNAGDEVFIAEYGFRFL